MNSGANANQVCLPLIGLIEGLSLSLPLCSHSLPQNQHMQQSNQTQSQQSQAQQHHQAQQPQQVQQPTTPAPVVKMPKAGKDGKPRGRMTAYAFFVQTCREEHKKKHPEESVIFAEFSRKCAERWKVSTEQQLLHFYRKRGREFKCIRSGLGSTGIAKKERQLTKHR